jgi:pimeloyl-ACP methyl ester carboxylesterase
MTVPFYVVPFDQDGRCTGPVTRGDLLKNLAEAEEERNTPYSDIFLFSHGWNTTWPRAVEAYETFINGFATLHADLPNPPGRTHRPLLVGVFWPSAVLVDPGESPPQMAGDGAGVAHESDELVGAEEATKTEIARQLRPEARARFYEMAQKPGLSGTEAREFSSFLAPLWFEDEARDDLNLDAGRIAETELLSIWKNLPNSDRGEGDQFGFARGGFGFGSTSAAFSGGSEEPSGMLPSAPQVPVHSVPDPQAAGLTEFLNPRELIRTTSVWMMKDRAGRVGADGVHGLMSDILTATSARVHLIGHSFGGKVVLSALCAGELPRAVESVLLLQPAISYLCFSPEVPGTGRPGGYFRALSVDRCRQPILSTFSARDFPLTKIFHLAVRRASDLGDIQIAAGPPGRYAALGGYGPAPGAGVVVVPAKDTGELYDFNGNSRVIGVESSRVIGGHSDVSNKWTWWMLLNQVRAEA